MKKLCIIGNNLSGLYNSLRYIDDDNIIVDIIDKKDYSNYSNEYNYYIYNFLNDNHKSYLNLLKNYNIKYNNINISYNDRLCNIINFIIDKSKLLPTHICSSYTFMDLCKIYLNNIDYEYINLNANYNKILSYINSIDFINIYLNDLTKNVNYYYIDNDNLCKLIKSMKEKINRSKNIKFINNLNINNLYYDGKQDLFVINSNYKYNYIISTLSKNNLIKLNIWNQNQINSLNNVLNVNSNNIKELFDNIIKFNLNHINDNENNTKKLLLKDLNLIYPINTNKNRKLYIWKTLENKNSKYILNEKIKYLFNNKFFICNLSYCSNNIFINYLFENIDKTNFIKKKLKRK